VVVGAGAIGIEFADFWNTFDVEVTVLEALPRILPIEDEEISEGLGKALRKKGITIHTGAKIESVQVKGKSVTTRFTTSHGAEISLSSDRLLLAVGLRGNVEGLGLEGMGVTLDRGFVETDDQARSTSPGIWAIGDCAGPPLLAHVAMAEGVACAERMAGRPAHGINVNAIPACTYCDPEVASVGQTEAQARASGLDIAVGRFPFSANGKSLGAGHTEGFVKVILNKAHNQILGVHALGHGVTDLMAEMSLAISSEATAESILASIHPHPTLSEVMYEATAAALGEAIHI
jgi:dihydrolipoamide dehydrogenase